MSVGVKHDDHAVCEAGQRPVVDNRRDEVDSIKGMYILLVVVGHNSLLTSAYPEFRWQLYNFHVAGFLLLPFIFRAKDFSRSLLGQRAVRYLVPYVVFYSLAALLYNAVLAGPSEGGLRNYLYGLLVGTHYSVKAGSGLALFWFLPVILSLSVLRGLATAGRAAYWSVLVGAVVIHMSVGLYSDVFRHNIPMGVLVAAHIYPLGVIVSMMQPVMEVLVKKGSKALWTYIIPLVFVILLVVSTELGLRTDLGGLRLESASTLDLLLLHDALILFAFWSLFAVSKLLCRIKILVIFGLYSLEIYLIHSFVFQSTLFVGLPVGQNPWVGSALLIVTLFVTLACALAINRLTFIRCLILPRGGGDFMAGLSVLTGKLGFLRKA